jgi:protease II
MQFSDIYDIEQDYPNLRDDEFLLDTANYIEAEEEITSEHINEAKLLHKILFKHTLQRLKEGKIIY